MPSANEKPLAKENTTLHGKKDDTSCPSTAAAPKNDDQPTKKIKKAYIPRRVRHQQTVSRQSPSTDLSEQEPWTKKTTSLVTTTKDGSHHNSTNNNTYNDVVRGMDQAYCTVNDEHNSDILARKLWARKAALGTFVVNVGFLTCGALFFASQTDWAVVDVALFTVYTVTSAGYGHVEIPQTALFRIVDTFFILIGMALMAIMMAQGYQFLVVEAKNFEYASDKAEVLQQGLEKLRREPPSAKRDTALAKLKKSMSQDLGVLGKFMLFMSRLVVFSVENPWGDFLHRIAGLVCLAGSGALVVGMIEGWNWYTAIYWSIVSLTTVGYGDVVPQTVAGKAFTTAWLPFNLFFLSILFCSVGHYYLIFSDKQISRIQKHLQDKRQEEINKKNSIHRQSSTDLSLPDPELGTRGLEPASAQSQDTNVSSRAMQTSIGSTRTIDLPMNRRFFGVHMETMKDVFDKMQSLDGNSDIDEENVGELSDPDSVMLHGDAPNFYLRVKVKERMAYIVAKEIAGSQSSLTTEDKAGRLSVFLGGTVEAVEKWMIPRSARRAFRAVAFEALLFVGESTLVKEGDSALHRLSPMEFHRIFSPLLVAMGDKDTLENWLVSTDLLWEKEAQCSHCRRKMSVRSMHVGHKDFAKSGEKVEFPTNHAEGFHLFHDT